MTAKEAWSIFSPMLSTPLSTLVLASAAIIVGLIYYSLVAGVCTFLWNQGKTLYRLYLYPVQIDATELHPFTRSLLANRTPEQNRLRQIQERLQKKDSPQLRSQAQLLISNIILTLNEERNIRIRNALISEFKVRQREFESIRSD